MTTLQLISEVHSRSVLFYNHKVYFTRIFLSSNVLRLFYYYYQAGHPWFSILTRTGVFKGKYNHTKFPADLVSANQNCKGDGRVFRFFLIFGGCEKAQRVLRWWGLLPIERFALFCAGSWYRRRGNRLCSEKGVRFIVPVLFYHAFRSSAITQELKRKLEGK